MNIIQSKKIISFHTFFLNMYPPLPFQISADKKKTMICILKIIKKNSEKADKFIKRQKNEGKNTL